MYTLKLSLANCPLIEAARLASSPCAVLLEPQMIVPPNAARANFHREYLTSVEFRQQRILLGDLHWQLASKLPDFLKSIVDEKLREKLQGINISGDRLCVTELIPPLQDQTAINCKSSESMYEISISDLKKIMRLSLVEKLKAKLTEISASSISYSEFIRICSEGCGNKIQGVEFVKTMDESGNVIVLGNVVFLQRGVSLGKSYGKGKKDRRTKQKR